MYLHILTLYIICIHIYNYTNIYNSPNNYFGSKKAKGNLAKEYSIENVARLSDIYMEGKKFYFGGSNKTNSLKTF